MAARKNEVWIRVFLKRGRTPADRQGGSWWGNMSTADILSGEYKVEGNLEVARLMKEATHVYHQI